MRTVALLGSMAAIISIIAGVYQFARSNRLSIFSKYCDKYNQIVKPEIYEDWVKALKGDKDLQIKLEPQMIAYLNLVWEELFLLEDKLISKKLWNHWNREIKETLSSSFAQDVMNKYDYHFPVSFMK
jgi:hypothetical protein